MSPINRRPVEDDEPDEAVEHDELPEIPAGYVPVRRPRRPAKAKRKVSPWWGVAGFVLAVAVTLTLIAVLSKPDPRDKASTTADAFAKAMTGHDAGEIDGLLCADVLRVPSEMAFLKDFGDTTVLGLFGDDQYNQSDARATLTSPAQPGDVVVIDLVHDTDGWCVSGHTRCPVPDPTMYQLPVACTNRPR